MEINNLIRMMCFNLGAIFATCMGNVFEGASPLLLIFPILYGLHLIHEIGKFERFKQKIILEALPEILKKQEKKSDS